MKEIEIPEGYEARIENNKVILEPKENEEDKRIREWLIEMVEEFRKANPTNAEHNGNCSEAVAYLEKQKHSLNFDVISSWLREHASNYVNGEFNEFHHAVEYDGTLDTERLIANLKAAID